MFRNYRDIYSISFKETDQFMQIYQNVIKDELDKNEIFLIIDY